MQIEYIKAPVVIQLEDKIQLTMSFEEARHIRWALGKMSLVSCSVANMDFKLTEDLYSDLGNIFCKPLE